MRLFVALEIPDGVRREVEALMRGVERDLPKARWVRPEKLHLTLSFLGEVEKGRLSALLPALAAVFGAGSRFTLVAAGGGGFPPRRPARVAWVGLHGHGSEDDAKLAMLQAEVAASAAFAAGIEPERRAFHAHLTLARPEVPWPAAAVERFARAADRRFGGPFPVGEGVLMESELGAGGARYRPVERFAIGGGRRAPAARAERGREEETSP